MNQLSHGRHHRQLINRTKPQHPCESNIHTILTVAGNLISTSPPLTVRLPGASRVITALALTPPMSLGIQLVHGTLTGESTTTHAPSVRMQHCLVTSATRSRWYIQLQIHPAAGTYNYRYTQSSSNVETLGERLMTKHKTTNNSFSHSGSRMLAVTSAM